MPEMIKLKLGDIDNYFVREAYRVLRTNILFCGPDIKTIVITSPLMNEGKTTVSLHLGASLAELGKRVLVMDTDMRKSVMAGRESNVKNVVGLSEMLTEQCALASAIYPTQMNNLNVMFAGQFPPNPAELLSGQRFAKLMEVVREIYDYVIIDTPPLGMVVDAAIVATKCDGAAILLGGGAHVPQVQEVVDMLKKSGCSLLGVILNRAGKGGGRYEKYSKYGKYRKYGKYGKYGKYSKYGQYSRYETVYGRTPSDRGNKQ